MEPGALFVATVFFVILIGSVHLARRIGSRVLRVLAQALGAFLAVVSVSFTAMQFASPVWVARQAGYYLGFMLLLYLLGSLALWLVRLVKRRRVAA